MPDQPKLPIYYINLADAATRRTAMEAQFDKLHLQAIRVEAVTPAEITAEERAAYCNPERYDWLTATEYSCTRSHLKCWEALVASGERYGVVLEDDVVLSEQLQEFLAAIGQWGGIGEGNIIKLETSAHPLRVSPRSAANLGPFTLRHVYGFDGGAAAYVISASMARSLLSMRRGWSESIDRVLFNSFRPLQRIPFLQVDPGLAIQARKLGAVDDSAVAGQLQARASARHQSRLVERAFGARRWWSDNVIDGVQRLWLDATGNRKRTIPFQP